MNISLFEQGNLECAICNSSISWDTQAPATQVCVYCAEELEDLLKKYAEAGYMPEQQRTRNCVTT